MTDRPCTNRIDPDDEESQLCGDEGGYCPTCFEAQDRYWRSYFGFTPEMTPEERRAKVEYWRTWLVPTTAGVVPR